MPTPPVLVLGRGSNLLVADRGFPGLGVVLTGDFETVAIDADGVTAGAAAPLPVLARRAAAAGLTGLEFYVGIPGSVGGAVRMNAGGHGRDTAEVLRQAWTVDLTGDPSPRRRDVLDLDLRYRHSALSATDVVTRAEFLAWPDAPGDVRGARSTRSSGGAASTSRAARTPARSSATRRATRPAASSTPPA